MTVGVEVFSRIAPSVPIIANVVIADNLFEVLNRVNCWSASVFCLRKVS